MITGEVLEGKRLESIFTNSIEKLQSDCITFLSQFDGDDLLVKWCEFIRHIEELYNITSLTDIEEDDLLLYCDINIHTDDRFLKVLEIVGSRYGSGVKNRFMISCMMLSSLNFAYYVNRQGWNCVNTLGEAILRCQAMRLYYVSMLMFIPRYCKGIKKVDFVDLLNVFQPMIDTCLVKIRTAYDSLMVYRCLGDLKAVPNEIGLSCDFVYNHLEGEFLEPVRMTIFDVMKNMTKEELEELPDPCESQLYGYEELMHGIVLSSAVYRKYGLNEIKQFEEMRGLAVELKPYLRDNYFFVVPSSDFELLSKKYSTLKLWCDSENFYDMLNSRPAFFKLENYYYSSVLLYQRFMVNEELRLLDRKKKFQIDSGFVFEKEVKSVLCGFGYDVKKVKRIKRKEFDVICIKDNSIYNFQCKNNSVSVSEQGEEWFKRTCSSIKRLTHYYEKALKKEDEREDLLKKELGINTVHSFVISRFPVITRNSRIINYNQLVLRLEQGL